MDWNQSIMYEQRVRFILEVQQRTFSFARVLVRTLRHQRGPRDITSSGHGLLHRRTW